MSGLLDGQLIVNTRPLHQQQGLTDLLISEGAEVLVCPAIDIVAAPHLPMHSALSNQLVHYQAVIFVSANAVEYAFRYVQAVDFPPGIRMGAIGEGTAKALIRLLPGRDAQIIRGKTSNSEGLLDVPEMQDVKGKRVLVFRGQSGRNLLGDELTRRGAHVDYCEVYRRQPPAALCDEILQLPRTPGMLLFTSNEGMANFMNLLPDHIKLAILGAPWLLISERMRESARQLGHNAEIIIASDASETGILRSVCEWVSRKKTKS